MAKSRESEEVEKTTKRKPFVVNKDAYKEVSKKGSTHKPSMFINLRDLSPGTYYFRVQPPLPDQEKAIGRGVPIVPLLSWFLAKGGQDGFISSVSEISLGEDEDSVTSWLKDEGLHQEKGFNTVGARGISDRVSVWRSLARKVYDKSDDPVGLAPNRGDEYALTVIPVERTLAGEKGHKISVPKDTAKFLVLNSKLNRDFERLLDAIDGIHDVEDGQDLVLSITLAKKDRREYTLATRGQNTELEDWEDQLGAQPSLIAELRRGCKPQEVIKFLAGKLEYEVPRSVRSATDDEGDDDEDEEEEEKPNKTKKKPARLDLGKGAKKGGGEDEDGGAED